MILARERVGITLSKHFFALSKLWPSTGGLSETVHIDIEYINLNAILHDPPIHVHCFSGVTHLANHVIKTAYINLDDAVDNAKLELLNEAVVELD